MQDVKTALEDLEIEETEILTLLNDDQLFEAVRIFEQKSSLNLETIMSLLEAIKNGQKQFIFNPEVTHNAMKVRYENREGILTVRLSEGSEAEKVVYPDDRDWLKVKKVLGHKPEIIEFEKDYLDHKIKSSKKSSLFIEESRFAKGKIVLIIAALLILVYFIYQKF